MKRTKYLFKLETGLERVEETNLDILRNLLHSNHFRALYHLLGKNSFELDECLDFFQTLCPEDDKKQLSFLDLKEILQDKSNESVTMFFDKYKKTRLSTIGTETFENGLKINYEGSEKGASVYLDMDKWTAIVAEALKDDLRFVLKKSLLRSIHYRHLHEDTKENMSGGWIFSAVYWKDFWFYECNNNGLLALFLSDDNHPLSRMERFEVEFILMSWVFYLSALLEGDGGISEINWFVSIIFVTLPSLVLRKILVFLYTCPCLISRHEEGKIRSIIQSMGHFIALPVVILGVLLFIGGIIFAVQHGAYFVSLFFLNWTMGFVFQAVEHFCLPFNPFECVHSSSKCICFRVLLLSTLFELSAWHSERLQVAKFVSEHDTGSSNYEAVCDMGAHSLRTNLLSPEGEAISC